MRMGSSYFRLSRADISSVNLSSDSSDEEGVTLAKQPRVKKAAEMPHRPSEGESSGGGSRLSNERNVMKEQLQHVKAALNALAPSPPVPSPTNNMATPGAKSGRDGAMENLLEDIASRLASIEGMYVDMSQRIVRVDHRTGDNERSVRELQHISAGAINETVRLVDLVGNHGRSPSPLAVRPGLHMTPPPPTLSPQYKRGSPETATAPVVQVAATMHQHSSQIHKLIAGLDFLEQHIIRQDQVIEGVQKQLLTVTGTASLHSPNELALRIHDVSELVNKLRSHMYKLEKKSNHSEATVQALASRVTQLTERLDLVERASTAKLLGGSTANQISNPLFASPDAAKSKEVAAQARDIEDLKAQVAYLMASMNKPTASFPSQSQDQPIAQLIRPLTSDALRTDESLGNVEALRAQQAETSELASKLQSELAEVQGQLSALVETVEDRLEGLHQQVLGSRKGASAHPFSLMSPPNKPFPTAPPTSRSLSFMGNESLPQITATEAVMSDPGLLEQLQAGIDGLVEKVSVTSGGLDARIAAAEVLAQSAAEAAANATKGLDGLASLESVAMLERDLLALSGRLTISQNTPPPANNSNNDSDIGNPAEDKEGGMAEGVTAAVSSAEFAARIGMVEMLEKEVQEVKAAAEALKQDLAKSKEQQDEGLCSLVVSQSVMKATLGALLSGMAEESRSVMQQVAKLSIAQLQATQAQREGMEATTTALEDVMTAMGQQAVAEKHELTELAVLFEHVAGDVMALRRGSAASESVQQSLQEDTAGLMTAQQGLREAMEVIGKQVVDLGGKVDEEGAARLADELEMRKELQSTQELMLEMKVSHDSDLEAVKTEITELKEDSSRAAATANTVEEVTQELDRAQLSLRECQERMGELATQVQLTGVASVVEEMQTLQRDLLVDFGNLKESLDRDFISHEKLGAIFAAREDMKAAITRLERVFTSGGRMTSQVSEEASQTLGSLEDSLARAGMSMPHIAAAIEELGSQITDLQSQINTIKSSAPPSPAPSARPASLTSTITTTQVPIGGLRGGVREGARQDGIVHTVSEAHAAASTEAAESLPSGVEEEGSCRETLSFFEVGNGEKEGAEGTEGDREAVLRMTKSARSFARRQAHIGTLEEASARIVTLEQQVRDLREFAAEAEGVLQQDLPNVKTSVADLQLMVFELRAAPGLARSGSSVKRKEVLRGKKSHPLHYPGFAHAAPCSGYASSQPEDSGMDGEGDAEEQEVEEGREMEVEEEEERKRHASLTGTPAPPPLGVVPGGQVQMCGTPGRLSRTTGAAANETSGFSAPGCCPTEEDPKGEEEMDVTLPPPLLTIMSERGPAPASSAYTLVSVTTGDGALEEQISLGSQLQAAAVPITGVELEGGLVERVLSAQASAVSAVTESLVPADGEILPSTPAAALAPVPSIPLNSVSESLDALKLRLDSLEGSLLSKVMALESHLYSLAPFGAGAVQQAHASAVLVDLPLELESARMARMGLRNDVDELQADIVTLQGQLQSLRVHVGVGTPRKGSMDGSSNPASMSAPSQFHTGTAGNVSILDALAATHGGGAQARGGWARGSGCGAGSQENSMGRGSEGGGGEPGGLQVRVQKVEEDLGVLSSNLEGLALPTTRATEAIERLKVQLESAVEKVQGLSESEVATQARIADLAAELALLTVSAAQVSAARAAEAERAAEEEAEALAEEEQAASEIPSEVLREANKVDGLENTGAGEGAGREQQQQEQQQEAIRESTVEGGVSKAEDDAAISSLHASLQMVAGKVLELEANLSQLQNQHQASPPPQSGDALLTEVEVQTGESKAKELRSAEDEEQSKVKAEEMGRLAAQLSALEETVGKNQMDLSQLQSTTQGELASLYSQITQLLVQGQELASTHSSSMAAVRAVSESAVQAATTAATAAESAAQVASAIGEQVGECAAAAGAAKEAAAEAAQAAAHLQGCVEQAQSAAAQAEACLEKIEGGLTKVESLVELAQGAAGQAEASLQGTVQAASDVEALVEKAEGAAGVADGAAQKANEAGERAEVAAGKAEVAAEKVEAASQKVEAAAEKMEAGSGRAEGAAEKMEGFVARAEKAAGKAEEYLVKGEQAAAQAEVASEKIDSKAQEAAELSQAAADQAQASLDKVSESAAQIEISLAAAQTAASQAKAALQDAQLAVAKAEASAELAQTAAVKVETALEQAQATATQIEESLVPRVQSVTSDAETKEEGQLGAAGNAADAQLKVAMEMAHAAADSAAAALAKAEAAACQAELAAAKAEASSSQSECLLSTVSISTTEAAAAAATSAAACISAQEAVTACEKVLSDTRHLLQSSYTTSSLTPSHSPSAAAAATAATVFSSVEKGGGSSTAVLDSAGQAAFLHKLVEVVRRQSMRMHDQYMEEKELEGQLQQVDSTLTAVEQQLKASPPAASQDSSSSSSQETTYAEALVTILEQVAALRTIGSQTHPAIHQMLMSHDTQIQELEGKVATLGSGDGNGKKRGGEECGEEGERREGEKEEEEGGEQLRTVAAKVAHLEGMMAAMTPKMMNGDIGKEQAGDSSSDNSAAYQTAPPAPAVDSLALTNLEGKLSEYGRVLQAMRTRIVSLQEYVDSTQGMVKELHTVHGSVLMRLNTLESSGGLTSGDSSDNGTPPSGSSAILRAVQGDLQNLQGRFAAFQHGQGELSNALEGLHRVGARLAELDARDGEMASKLAAVGQTMPVLANQLKSLERKLHSKLDGCCTQLESLGQTLAEVSRLEKADSKNPFAGLGGANNPTIRLLENKVELLRSALSNVAKALAEDLKADRSYRGLGE